MAILKYIRVLLSIVMYLIYEILQLDVKIVLLNDYLDIRIYMM